MYIYTLKFLVFKLQNTCYGSAILRHHPAVALIFEKKYSVKDSFIKFSMLCVTNVCHIETIYFSAYYDRVLCFTRSFSPIRIVNKHIHVRSSEPR